MCGQRTPTKAAGTRDLHLGVHLGHFTKGSFSASPLGPLSLLRGADSITVWTVYGFILIEKNKVDKLSFFHLSFSKTGHSQGGWYWTLEWGLGKAKERQLDTKDLDRNINQAKEVSRGRTTEKMGPQRSQWPTMSSWSHVLSSGVVSVAQRPGGGRALGGHHWNSPMRYSFSPCPLVRMSTFF